MVEIPEAFDVGMKPGNKFDDIDLELRLSTGGRLYKEEEVAEPKKDREPKNPDLDYGDNVQTCSRSSFSLGFVSEMETSSLVVDKRAMQALRRKEVKKKMEEKNRKKKMMMMKRQLKRSVKERDSEEEEGDERLSKKEKVEEGIGLFNKGEAGCFPASAFPPHVVAQMSYPCQWIPNGFGYTVPFWYLGVEGNGVVAVGGFNMCGVEQNKAGCGEGIDRKAGSGGSTLCSSNAGSGDLVSPLQGDKNGDTVSHSTLSQTEKRRFNSSTASSTRRSLNRDTVDDVEGIEDNTVSTNSSRNSPTRIVQEVGNSETENPPDNSCNDTSNLNPVLTKNTEGEEEHYKHQIFRVSTTGNGPNGRTITGMLGRCTKNEATITCTCHGSSFSPAEFVEHAGGTNVTHPLRHIVMVP